MTRLAVGRAVPPANLPLASSAQFVPGRQMPATGFLPAAAGSPFTPTFFVKSLMTIAFFVSLMQYWVVVANAGLIPIACVYLAGFIVLLSRDRVEKLSRILGGGRLLMVFALLSELISYFTGDTFSIQYGLILIGLFLVARLIVMQIGFLQLIRCYLYSAVMCTLVILIAGRKQLSDYQGGETRFTGGAGAHPNLLGFTLASYVPLFLGLAFDLPRGKKRLFMGALTVVTIILLFTTGSRGSLGAILIAAAITVTRFTVFNPLLRRLRLSQLQVLLGLIAIAAVIYVLFHGNRIAGLVKFFITALQINSAQRGIHSGFSGRTILWTTTIHRLSGLQWLFGMGYRQGFLIDSGYITVLFDNGLLGGSVIVGSILRVVYWLWKSTARMESAGWWRYHLILSNLIIIYLVNNFTTRYLFSYGNQFSLLIIFVMVCQRSELLGRVSPRRLEVPQPVNLRQHSVLPIR